MTRAKVIRPGSVLTAGQWLAVIEGAPVIAVIGEDEAHLLGPLLAQLGTEQFISALRPVGEALKIVEAGFIVGSVDRGKLVEPVPPFAFRAELAVGALRNLEADLPVDLLQRLAEMATPLWFRDSVGS